MTLKELIEFAVTGMGEKDYHLMVEIDNVQYDIDHVLNIDHELGIIYLTDEPK